MHAQGRNKDTMVPHQKYLRQNMSENLTIKKYRPIFDE